MEVYLVQLQDDNEALDRIKIKIFKTREKAQQYYNEEVKRLIKKYNINELIQNEYTMIMKQEDYFNLFNVNEFNVELAIFKKELED